MSKPVTFLVERFTSVKGGHEYAGGLRFDAAGMTATITKEDGAIVAHKMEMSDDQGLFCTIEYDGRGYIHRVEVRLPEGKLL